MYTVAMLPCKYNLLYISPTHNHVALCVNNKIESAEVLANSHISQVQVQDMANMVK